MELKFLLAVSLHPICQEGVLKYQCIPLHLKHLISPMTTRPHLTACSLGCRPVSLQLTYAQYQVPI